MIRHSADPVRDTATRQDMTRPPAATSHADDVRAVLDLRAARDVAAGAVGRSTTAASVEVALIAGERLDVAVSAYTTRWHKRRRGRVVVAGDAVWWVTPTGRTRNITNNEPPR